MKTSRLFTLLILFVLMNIFSTCSPPEKELYLFTYFVKEKDGMYMAVSTDGMQWTPINNNQPVLKSYVGDSLLRDPSIIQDNDGRFHLVFTTSWTNLGFGYTSSTNLVNWEKQQFIPVDKGLLSDGVRNAWAPEFYYEKEDDEFYIIWASAKKKIPTLKNGFKGDQKQYFIKTKDFQSFTQPALLYGDHLADASVIDTYIIHPDDKYYFFFKFQATHFPDGGKDGVHVMSAPDLHGPYTEHQPIPNARGNSEGPTATKIGDYWVVYYDAPKGAARSLDLENWEDISDQVQYPPGFRHGSVITVRQSVITDNFEVDFLAPEPQ